jgi:hypothetical protein
MFAAVAGFALSAIAHITSIAGVELPGGKAVFLLHAGIFVVWLPALLVMHRVSGGINRRDLWKVALSGCPSWMRTAVYAIFVYAFLNFFYFFATTAGLPKHASGGVSTIAEVRGFSGHWMIFYSAAFAILYSARNRPGLLLDRRCSNQHAVSKTAEYCETCGERMPPVENGA